ncbi:MAG: hypothetical protein A3B91_00180 [Candidatus Yanofskybacteria bacterium RIFCSPHIGHO2_02_FULL_41_29]|uniref:Uncharacterized protein n=1 Tax=Candidatus Yanofskybacteria bacterium RIFCSPHIGHO2_01_FULL_41_53 TaxID=1802663 RepID=A0A1F8EJA4_9BACT|nr:MAG: hypothetical protein A2650_03235 [Candidatus Yanofskybacteria bacterium RIFCSPHIGHO2_01_FULL_41_53]OGN10540.1 MAG: hypothetical protein A3B91_00180 [Candidatus Yanofskybacteria bacterium RIFCSPHIGHO2_02_FULL_41_29]OGN17942.1 MAG: hypothetical protein A3F48_04540 [Candidatus Yanofskybacteria bacterium RIFCSPHIGHO2_12_FULL_41_9]OGN21687.1 MAG: hypothetical protein A2916_03955 [Candidatus Yanofskybacteria bacterium RIFCSPLOWO2_01_FULL_41_67]OGN29202.1 MAG: hypothetical protein A3H54_03430 
MSERVEPQEPNQNHIEQEIQQKLDTFFAGEFIEYNPESRDVAFNALTQALAYKEGFNPSKLDINYGFTTDEKAAELEVVDLDESTGEYYLVLIIRNKFTEGEEDKPKKWKFEYHLKVSPKYIEKYKKTQ